MFETRLASGIIYSTFSWPCRQFLPFPYIARPSRKPSTIRSKIVAAVTPPLGFQLLHRLPHPASPFPAIHAACRSSSRRRRDLRVRTELRALLPILDSIVSPGTPITALAAYDTTPRVLPAGFGLGAAAPPAAHYAERSSPPYMVSSSGFANDRSFETRPLKRQKLSSSAPDLGPKDNHGAAGKPKVAPPASGMGAPEPVPAKSRRVRTG